MQDYRSIEMPGRVTGLSVVGDKLYAVCKVENPWWRFWRPRWERLLYHVDVGFTDKITLVPAA